MTRKPALWHIGYYRTNEHMRIRPYDIVELQSLCVHKGLLLNVNDYYIVSNEVYRLVCALPTVVTY